MENKQITEILEWILRHTSDWNLSKTEIFSIRLATRAYKAWDRAFTEMENKGLHEAMEIMNKNLCEVKINDTL